MDNKKDTKNKISIFVEKTLDFISKLFKEVNDEIIKLFENIGIFKILIGLVLFLFLRFIATSLEYKSDFDAIIMIVVFLAILAYNQKLKEGSTIKKIINFLIIALSSLLIILIFLSFVLGIKNEILKLF